MTYEELERASNRLARLLKQAGCGRGDRVALLLPKSLQAIVGILASLKADCMYVPIDTSSPTARVSRILQSCESRCILAAGSTATLLDDLLLDGSAGAARVIWTEHGRPEGGPEDAWNLDHARELSDLPVASENSDTDGAHILFTSGSTGIPKGVVITHSNVAHFVDWAVEYFGTSPSDRISGHPPLHFDLSTYDIYGTLGSGAELHLAPPELNLLPNKLADFIRRSELTQWFSVPSALNHMAKFDVVKPNDFPTLKRLLWCGEKFPTPGLIYWMKRLPQVSFTNLYGPTEATIASSYYRVPACPRDETAEIPIGVACDGEELLVLDEQMRPTGPDEVGDLYIAGVGLSPGYWRDPEKTRAAFLTRPGSSDPNDRIYRTGDLARVGMDGLVYLLGRADSQIKSRGYRIELGEIEAALHAIDGLRESAVVAVETSGLEGNVICCAYVPAQGSSMSEQDLKGHLAQALPHYMIPARWLALDRMPLNGNGKIDRPQLRKQFHPAQPHEAVKGR